MNEIDHELRRLAEAPPPARLARIEAAVLERTQGHRFGRREFATPVRVVVMTLALAMGIAGGLIPDRSADAADRAVSLSDASRLAPSTLLLGDR